MNHRKDNRHERGNVLVAALFVVIVLGASITSMFRTTVSSQRATLQNSLETKLLYVAESGINFHAVSLSVDPLVVAKDTAGFTENKTTSEYDGVVETVTTANDITRQFQVRVQYLNGTTPVLFADRAKPTEEWTTLKMTSRASVGASTREVVSWYRFELGEAFASAIISDSISTGSIGLSGKSQAKTGDIILEAKGRPGQHYVFGGARANGGIRYYENGSETATLTTANASTYIGGWEGDVEQGLAGTSNEIPDFTSLGGTDQLFDFDRFKAAAAAGSGQIYNTLADFAAACNAANAAGTPLEGITVINIDSAAEGSNPKLVASGTGIPVPDGINCKGTLVFSFSNGTSSSYKVFLKIPLKINAADLSSWDPAVESTYTTGYPPVYSVPLKAPSAAVITPTYENFKADDGLPALMFDNGVVDIHGDTNVCGVVYGPSFIEIENKSGLTQYFNGSIIGGGGIYLEGHSSSGVQAFRFDPVALKNLQTFENKGKGLVRIGFSVVK